jgi:hypothetical protein
LVYLANVARFVGGHVGEAGLYCGDKVRVELRYEVIVGLFLGRVGEGRPGELVNIPRVVEVDVGKRQYYVALRLGQRCDEEVRTQ